MKRGGCLTCPPAKPELQLCPDHPNRWPGDEHSDPEPSDYGGRISWANKMLLTHRQKRCPTCGLWARWEKR